MIWDVVTGVFNLPYSLGITTDYMIPSTDKYGFFLSFYDAITFLALSVASPSSESFPLYSTPYSSPYEFSLVVFTKMPSFWCTWFSWFFLCGIRDRTWTALSSFFLFLFGGNVFGAACLKRLPFWVWCISSVWRKYNDLAQSRMGKFMIYHIQSRSEIFRTTFQTKLRNEIEFGTGTSFMFAWHMPNSNPIQDKDNPRNVSGRFQKYFLETLRIMICNFLEI